VLSVRSRVFVTPLPFCVLPTTSATKASFVRHTYYAGSLILIPPPRAAGYLLRPRCSGLAGSLVSSIQSVGSDSARATASAPEPAPVGGRAILAGSLKSWSIDTSPCPGRPRHSHGLVPPSDARKSDLLDD
jgi:hypothetical protein